MMNKMTNLNEDARVGGQNRNFDDQDDLVIDSLVSELNSLGFDMAVKDEKIKHLSHLADRGQAVSLQLQRQIDVCVGILAQLKSVGSMEEVEALLNSYETEGYTIPYLN